MQIKDKIKNKHFGVIFDGRTHVSGALAIVLRFISDFIYRKTKAG